MRSAFALLTALVLAACGPGDSADAPAAPSVGTATVESNESEHAEVPDTDAAVAVDTTGPAEVTVAGQTVPTRAFVTNVEAGDRACHLTLRTASGSRRVLGDFSLCEGKALLGQRVQMEWAPDDVIAEACESDPECLDTETVPLVVAADVIGR